MFYLDSPQHLIGKTSRAPLGDTEAQGVRLTGLKLLFSLDLAQPAADTVIHPWPPRRLCCGPTGFQLLGSTETRVCVAALEELPSRFPVSLETLRLTIGSLVPIKPQPPKPIEDSLDHLFGRTFEVGIFDTENEDATLPPCQ